MAAVQETIRMTGRDNRWKQRELTDRTGSIAPSRESPAAYHADRSEDSHLLCRSV